MKKHRLSHRQKSCKVGTIVGVEKTAVHLLEIPGLSKRQNCCTISLNKAHRPEGGAIMAEMIKQSEGKEELLQQDTIKEDIVSMVEKIKVPMDLERIRRFVAYIYVHH